MRTKWVITALQAQAEQREHSPSLLSSLVLLLPCPNHTDVSRLPKGPWCLRAHAIPILEHSPLGNRTLEEGSITIG